MWLDVILHQNLHIILFMNFKSTIKSFKVSTIFDSIIIEISIFTPLTISDTTRKTLHEILEEVMTLFFVTLLCFFISFWVEIMLIIY